MARNRNEVIQKKMQGIDNLLKKKKEIDKKKQELKKQMAAIWGK